MMLSLGFYYHIDVHYEEGKIALPDYLGVFVEELAKHCSFLYYFAYTSDKRKTGQNYILSANNIFLVDLGRKRVFPVTVITGWFVLGRFKDISRLCSAILVRGPSPLAPYFFFRFRKYSAIHYLMVGDYMEGIKHQNFNFIKQKMINLFTRINEFQQNVAISRSGCIVNSIPLKEKYIKICKRVALVKTTTLTKEYFYQREDTCLNPFQINVLFVGRIEKAKGLDELIEVFTLLRKKRIPVFLKLAGWDTIEARSYIKKISSIPEFNEVWQYYGLVSGKDLLDLYRGSDIFVLPSHHEGFPRVIWEAMANSLPVIATKVGSIPFFLQDRLNASIVEKKNIKRLFSAILEIIEDSNYRRELIRNGYSLVGEYTMDKQVELLIKEID